MRRIYLYYATNNPTDPEVVKVMWPFFSATIATNGLVSALVKSKRTAEAPWMVCHRLR